MKTSEKKDYIRYHIEYLNKNYDLKFDFHKEYWKSCLFKNNHKIYAFTLDEIINYIDWFEDWIRLLNEWCIKPKN